jgi:predicted nuclease of predicted toxin-antitoxin system
MPRICRYAGAEGLILVSKDSDFFHRSLVRGHPPKFIYVRAGNCSTAHIAESITARVEQIEAFAADPAESVLLLS